MPLNIGQSELPGCSQGLAEKLPGPRLGQHGPRLRMVVFDEGAGQLGDQLVETPLLEADLEPLDSKYYSNLVDGLGGRRGVRDEGAGGWASTRTGS